MGGWRRFNTGIAAAIAVATVILHSAENLSYHRHLEYLADPALARVSSLQTENGFYYSYYSELVEAESTASGLQAIIWDTRSEYPETINSFRRFNVYQEAALALVYRALRSCGLAFVSAWSFFRYTLVIHTSLGQAAIALLSAEMSGNPCAGILCFIFSFLNRFQISRFGSYASGDLREHWGCPLLWMQILFMWHMITGCERSIRFRRFLWCGFTTTTFLFLVSWQFSPFLLLLQATSLYFICLVCGYRSIRTVFVSVLNGYIAAMIAAIALHFGSPYLLTSPFLAQLAALKVATSLRNVCMRCGGKGADVAASPAKRWMLWVGLRGLDVLEGLMALAAFACVLKAMAPFATADTHIYDIACTKAAVINGWLPTALQLPESRLPECTEPSFNARLYLIMGVFKELQSDSLQLYRKTTAGPAAAITCALVFLRVIMGVLLPAGDEAKGGKSRKRGEPVAKRAKGNEEPAGKSEGLASSLRKRKGGKAETKHATPMPGSLGSGRDFESVDTDEYEEAAQLFFVVQFLFFLFLGFLINRLRVAFGPPMMVLAASVFGPRLFALGRRRTWLIVLLFVFHAGYTMWVSQMLPCAADNEGICNQMDEKKTHDGDLVDLIEWANAHLPQGLPLLASMNLAGTLRAFIGNPMVIHPQFESENLRKRVQLGYEMYHCGSEESFAQTMQKLKAKVVIFEYARCFFTPYILDDRRKNCIDGKHQREDQLCLKLHVSPERFKLLFMNGGYAVFKLQKNGTSSDLSPAAIKNALEDEGTWVKYVEACASQQGESCGARLAENVATWYHGLKRAKVAHVLRTITMRQFPDDGMVAYYMGRYLDYDAKQSQKAGKYYAAAAEKLPDNPIVLKEYLMWLDMEAKDAAKVQKLIERRQGKGKPLMELAGPSVSELLCEAAASAKQLGQEKFSQRLWAKTLRLAPHSKCVKNNWPLMHPGSTFEDAHSQWDLVRHLYRAGVPHDIGAHHGPAVRYLEARKYDLTPRRKSQARP